mgnify:CR=1 FL=1
MMNTVINVPKIFGSDVFNEATMRQRLSAQVYNAWRTCIDTGAELKLETANAIAEAMKDWALEKGATHYTHWFQPLTGITSEKHDGFVSPVGDGTAIMEFNGKELVRGEPDASSFPSGGLRATCEARGYTAWDPTSFAFVKDDVLCIPTAFVSYTGEALDKKTPLLRSMNALSNQAIRVLKLFGKDVDYVSTTVGPEQEYFLIKKEDYEARQDLILTGRTLFGAPSAKGQELEEHYFGVIRPEVSAFMKELDEELWKLGIPAKTKHNEVAPCQHELAPIFDTTNVAIDHNLLTMEMMKKLAPKYGLVCLQHEKPFEGVNGSGKHNNWSMSTTHENLLDPGDTPMENLQFLVFLAAVIKAVDEYADLLRTSVATPGNDHRLGAHEAPPAIMSIFLGDQLTEVFEAFRAGRIDDAANSKSGRVMNVGVDTLPPLPTDPGDRNRTSPIAFTGNRFEFRALGSSQSAAGSITALNAIMADSLGHAADFLEGDLARGKDLNAAIQHYVQHVIEEHSAVIFNGDGYSSIWHAEAERRGLPNLRTTPEAMPELIRPEVIDLYERLGILNRAELKARYDIYLEQYCKTVRTEAILTTRIARTIIFPAAMRYQGELAETAARMKAIGKDFRTITLDEVTEQLRGLQDATRSLEATLASVDGKGDFLARATRYCEEVLPIMGEVRRYADLLETRVADDLWDLPSYQEILFGK